MNSTSIEWCNRPETRGPAGAKTWNPIRARLKGLTPEMNSERRTSSGTFCTRISPGCAHCYASTINKRFGNGLEFTVPNLEKVEFFIETRILVEPLQAKKPCTIFVGDMFDLFHEAIPQQFIAEVLRVALKTTWHTFQFLTKRAERMQRLVAAAQSHWGVRFDEHMWFGVSVEDQQRADERIPLLLQTPAAVRFLSVEPMLEAVRLDECAPYVLDGNESNPGVMNAFNTKCYHPATVKFAPEKAGNADGISWVICGGESGPGARPFNISWAESLLAQCEAAHVPFFMKQLGSKPERDGVRYIGNFDGYQRHEVTGKGGQMHEWPPSLRVREFPATERREAVTA